MSILFDYLFTPQDRAALNQILQIVQEVQSTMATKQELDDALAQLTATVNQLGTDMNQSFADLLAAINAGQDFSAEVQTIQGQIAQLQQFDATAKQDDPGAPKAPKP